MNNAQRINRAMALAHGTGAAAVILSPADLKAHAPALVEKVMLQAARALIDSQPSRDELIDRLMGLIRFIPKPQGPQRQDQMDTSAAYQAWTEADATLSRAVKGWR